MITKKLSYEFAPTGGGDETGFNDAVTTIFEGNTAYHLARESLQNIIDAADEYPAKAVFEMFPIKANQLPEIERLKEIFKACKEYKLHEKETVRFFSKALEVVTENKNINILRIGDFNTRGLTGDDCDQKGNYYSLMKAVGSSSKSEGQGGSFGLGKGSYFAASLFRMMFVSSIYEKNKPIFQGKLRLISHLKDGEPMQGNGSFGLAKQKPVRDLNDIPDLFSRKEQGTDFFIVGFEDAENWQDHISKSVLNYFWNAILKGLLEVKVNDLNITKENIGELMLKYFSEEQRDTNDNPNPLPYFNAYNKSKESGHFFEEDLPFLGKCQLYVLPSDIYPSRISYIRSSGMVIQKKPHQCMKSYAGVFICDNKKGNALLREMENPSHDKWSKDFAKQDGKVREDAKSAERELKDFAHMSLLKLSGTEEAKSLYIPGLEKYLYLPGDQNSERLSSGSILETSGYSDEETGSEVGVEKDEPVETKIPNILPVIKKQTTIDPEETGVEPIDTVVDGIGSGGILGKLIKKLPVGGNKKIKAIENIKYRTFAVKNSENKEEHIIIVRGPKEISCALDFQAGTDDSFDTLKILKATDEKGTSYPVNDSRITNLRFNSDGIIKLNVKFDTDERYALKINAYQL